MKHFQNFYKRFLEFIERRIIHVRSQNMNITFENKEEKKLFSVPLIECFRRAQD